MLPSISLGCLSPFYNRQQIDARHKIVIADFAGKIAYSAMLTPDTERTARSS